MKVADQDDQLVVAVVGVQVDLGGQAAAALAVVTGWVAAENPAAQDAQLDAAVAEDSFELFESSVVE